MLRKFPDRLTARDSTVACFVFVLTASEVAAVFGSPTEWRFLTLLMGTACLLVSFVVFLDVYYRLKDRRVLWNIVSLAWVFVLALPVLVIAVLLWLHADIWFAPPGSG